MRLGWPARRCGWEPRLVYSCLGPLRLLGDLRHLAAWWLARLAELGGLARLRGLGRLCGLHGLGRLCRLCRLSGLQGLTVRSWALEFRGEGNGVESVLHTAPCPLAPSYGLLGRVSCRYPRSQAHAVISWVLRIEGSRKRSPTHSPAHLCPQEASPPHHDHHENPQRLPRPPSSAW